MFTPGIIRDIATNPSAYVDTVTKLKSTIHNGARGGSLKLRRFVRDALAGSRQYLSDGDLRYLSNESNYLWARNFGKLNVANFLPTQKEAQPPAIVSSFTGAPLFKRQISVSSSHTPQPVTVDAKPQPFRGEQPNVTVALLPAENTPISETSNVAARGLIDRWNSTEAWINNVLFFIKQVGGNTAKYVTRDVIYNLLRAEVGAKARDIDPRKSNFGYMGAFQMGINEWNSNRKHGFSGAPDGAYMGSVGAGKRMTKDGSRKGPADVLVAPAVWVRYIAKVVSSRNFSVGFLQHDPVNCIYLYHNQGEGTVKQILNFHKTGTLSGGAAWAIATQLSYNPVPEKHPLAPYWISRKVALRRTSAENRPLRAVMAALRYTGSTMSEQAVKNYVINRAGQTTLRYRLKA